MYSRLIVAFLVGFVVSTYALPLSDSKKRADELDPRVFSFLNDLYAQVIYPPLNHIVTSLSLLGAQVLAGISENGLPAPGGRILHPTDAQIRGFFDDLWNNALKPPLENALSGLSLMAAQVLAGLGTNGVNLSNLLGKRDLTEAEMRDFFTALSDAMNSVFTNVIQKPLEDALSGGALMLAQVLAGLGTNGVNLSNLLGKRDLTEAEMRDFFTALNDAMNSVFTNVIQKPLEDALSGGALMLAQVLAGLGTNGVNLSNLFGKRDLTEAEMRDFFTALSDAMNSVFTNVIQKPLEDALSGGALMLAQVLAGLGTNGVNLSNLLGKRDLSTLAGREEELRGFFDTLGQTLLSGLQTVWTDIIQNPLEQALQSGALMAAQVLAGLGTNGVNLGKREIESESRGAVLDGLISHATGLYQEQVKPLLENALNNAALHLAGVLANFSQNGFGRR